MRTRRHAVNGLLTLLIYGIFALFSLFLVVIGARVYRNIVAAGRENTQLRSSFSYVANKVRMSTRAAGSVRLEEQEGMEVLVLESGTEGYETRIYYYDGALREAYQASDRPLDPKLGIWCCLPQTRAGTGEACIYIWRGNPYENGGKEESGSGGAGFGDSVLCLVLCGPGAGLCKSPPAQPGEQSADSGPFGG